MRYFDVDSKRVIHFRNTEQLAKDITAVIDTLRLGAARLDPELAQYVRRKTPGRRVVALGVRLVLRNNGFDMNTMRFSYQGRLGIVTRPINMKLNRKIAAATPDPEDLAQLAMSAFLSRQLQSSHVPAPVAQRIAGPLVGALFEASPPENAGGTDSTDLAVLLSKTKEFAAQEDAGERMHDFLEAGEGVATATAAGARALAATVRIDTAATLVTFEETRALADGVNEVIRAVREFATAVPVVGETLGPYVKKKTPGPKAVRLGVRAGLRGQTFNYSKMEFESQGSRVGTNKIVNHFLNKQIAAQREALLNVGDLTMRGIEYWIRTQVLGDLPESVSGPLARELSVRVYAMAMAQPEDPSA